MTGAGTIAGRFRRALVETPMMPIVRVKLRRIADEAERLNLDRLLPTIEAVVQATPHDEREARVDEVVRRAAAALGVKLLPVEANALRRILLNLSGVRT